MDQAKIRLSQTEMELVNNADLILTKNAILKKVNGLLGELQVKQQQIIALHMPGLPVKVSGSSPKISKGENYKGLPYLILDYPRLFEHTNIFAVRTMFWWGNFFSVTLHLSGIYKKEAEDKIIDAYRTLGKKGYYCYVNEDQWEHHMEGANYRLLSELSKNDFEKLVREKSFVKLANKIPLQQWDAAREILQGYFKEIIEMLAD
ncbi:MAG TPA: hypothetical protein VIV35_09705 [Chitinophagaceae bacterium]